MQTNYFTPIKNIQTYHRQLFNSDSTHREGDWVCVNCQNLNYSFRKKCNRCKTQSRQQNQKQHSVYSFYYYPRDHIASFDKSQGEDFCIDTRFDGHKIQDNGSSGYNENKQNQPSEWNAIMETPKKKKPLMSTQNSKLDGLPSVSPLVKKYRQKQHHTTLQKLRDNTNIFASSGEGKDFESIKIRDFDKLIQDLNFAGEKGEVGSSPFKQTFEQEDLQGIKFMKQMQESISRIII